MGELDEESNFAFLAVPDLDQIYAFCNIIQDIQVFARFLLTNSFFKQFDTPEAKPKSVFG